MKLSHKPFIFTMALLLTIFTVLSDFAYAGRGGGGRGGGGGSRGGGGARTSSVQRSSGSRSSGSRSNASIGGGASPRVGSSTSLQNRGNFSNSSQSRQGNRQASQGNRQDNRQTNQGERQTNRSDAEGNRQDNRSQNQGNRQDNMGNRQDNRQNNAGNRQDNRQNNAGNRQDSRQDFVNDNWYGGGWYGGGYYAPPGWGAWAGLAGLTAGLAIGASVSTPPPYYDTVYVGSTSYIYSDGVYMQPSNGGYVISSPPVGVVVNYLPDGCKMIQQGNIQYYDCAGIYYQTFYQNGATVYKVIQY